jgi:hypothetical protein
MQEFCFLHVLLLKYISHIGCLSLRKLSDCLAVSDMLVESSDL